MPAGGIHRNAKVMASRIARETTNGRRRSQRVWALSDQFPMSGSVSASKIRDDASTQPRTTELRP